MITVMNNYCIWFIFMYMVYMIMYFVELTIDIVLCVCLGIVTSVYMDRKLLKHFPITTNHSCTIVNL